MTFYLEQGYIKQTSLWNIVSIFMKGGFLMIIYVGIDVAKNKHDCFVINSNGKVLVDHFIFLNNLKGFKSFLSILKSFSVSIKNIKAGLEATGHYINNILEFLHSNGIQVFLINPLSTNLYGKGQSLRKTQDLLLQCL